jgi:hypothetical protein
MFNKSFLKYFTIRKRNLWGFYLLEQYNEGSEEKHREEERGAGAVVEEGFSTRKASNKSSRDGKGSSCVGEKSMFIFMLLIMHQSDFLLFFLCLRFFSIFSHDRSDAHARFSGSQHCHEEFH